MSFCPLNHFTRFTCQKQDAHLEYRALKDLVDLWEEDQVESLEDNLLQTALKLVYEGEIQENNQMSGIPKPKGIHLHVKFPLLLMAVGALLRQLQRSCAPSTLGELRATS